MRDIDPSAADALESGVVKFAVLVYVDLDAGELRLCSGRTVDWDGHTWTGAGTLGSIDGIAETAGEAEKKGLSMSLSGMSAAVLSSVLSASVRDHDCAIYFAVLDYATESVLDALQLFSGKLSQASITRTKDGRSIGVNVAHISDYFSRPKPFRNTDSDQRSAYSGDTSRRFVVSQAQKQDVWPAASWFRKQA